MKVKNYLPFIVAFVVLCVVILIIRMPESPIAKVTQWFSNRVEGFAMPVFTSPRCPPGYKFFTDKTGESYCCKGSVNPYSHACSGVLCSLRPDATDPSTKKPMPFCGDVMKQLWDTAESQCPKTYPNYALNGKCCASGSVQDGAMCSAEDTKDNAFCTLDDYSRTGEKLCSTERLKENVKCPQGMKSIVTPLSASDIQKYPAARGKSMIRCMDSFSSCFADESIKNLQAAGVFTDQGDSLKLHEASCSKWDTTNVQRNLATNPLPGKFLLRAPGKNNLCMDDGGGTAPGQSKMHLWTCDARNPNQHFEYLAQTQQIRNPNKNLCVDDGGGVANGQSKFHLWTCDPNNPNQRFVYNPYTKMFSNPNKSSGTMCIDDGGAYGPGTAKMHIWQCNAANPNQKFTAERIDLPITASKVPGLMLLQNPFKQNLCMDDGGGILPGQTKMHMWTCDKNNLNQQFTYDPLLKQLKNPNKNLCVDDGAGSKYHLWACDPNNKNQQFVYNPHTQMFANMNKGKCMDDGGGQFPGATKFDNYACSAANINQRFKPILL